MKLKVNKQILSEILNLNYDVYKPLSTFVSKKEFLNICYNMETKKNNFFPFPIYFGLSKQKSIQLNKIKIIKLYYKSYKICDFTIKDIFSFDKNLKIKLGKLLFQTNDLSHPGFKQFISKNNEYYLHGIIKNFEESILNKINFTKPKSVKSKKIKFLAGFHTRNAPHKGHEWIHRYGIKKCKNLLIQPLIGQFKKGEFKEEVIIKANLKYIEQSKYNNNILFAFYNSFPRYAGPREALMHAIVRRNYGCSHFLVGRDHAGIDNYYSKYESQNLCKKYEKKIKIKIINVKEPFICLSCKKIINQKCSCKKMIKKLISGTEIRKIILKGKIPSKNIFDKKVYDSITAVKDPIIK